jgi:hypothetical protein
MNHHFFLPFLHSPDVIARTSDVISLEVTRAGKKDGCLIGPVHQRNIKLSVTEASDI